MSSLRTLSTSVPSTCGPASYRVQPEYDCSGAGHAEWRWFIKQVLPIFFPQTCTETNYFLSQTINPKKSWGGVLGLRQFHACGRDKEKLSRLVPLSSASCLWSWTTVYWLSYACFTALPCNQGSWFAPRSWPVLDTKVLTHCAILKVQHFPTEKPQIAPSRGEKLSGVQSAAAERFGFSGWMAPKGISKSRVYSNILFSVQVLFLNSLSNPKEETSLGDAGTVLENVYIRGFILAPMIALLSVKNIILHGWHASFNNCMGEMFSKIVFGSYRVTVLWEWSHRLCVVAWKWASMFVHVWLCVCYFEVGELCQVCLSLYCLWR